MRPTGVTLIAIYHFLAAALLVFSMATALWILGALGARFAAGKSIPFGRIGFLAGVFVGAVCALIFAGYGLWTLREWGRILCIVLAVISILASLCGVFKGVYFGFLLGMIRLAINVLTIWYLLKPHINSLFRRNTPALP